MNFGMTTLNWNIKTKQNYVARILRALLSILKRKIFRKTYDESDKRPLSVGKNKKVICLFKDKLGGKIMIKFAGLKAKTYAYFVDDDDSKHKKAKGTKKCVIEWGLMFKNYKDCNFNKKTILSSNDDKRL